MIGIFTERDVLYRSLSLKTGEAKSAGGRFGQLPFVERWFRYAHETYRAILDPHSHLAKQYRRKSRIELG